METNKIKSNVKVNNKKQSISINFHSASDCKSRQPAGKIIVL